MLLTSSLFLACKVEEFYLPLEIIFKEISNTILLLQKRKCTMTAARVLGDRDFTIQTLNPTELRQVSNIEIDLLNSLNWNLSVDMPFIHINRHKYIFNDIGEPTIVNNLMNIIIRNLCLVVKSKDYLSFNVEISTISAVYLGFIFMNYIIPESVLKWIDEEKSKDENQFIKICNMITEKAQRCVKLKTFY